MGDELRDPCFPYMYCNPRRIVYSDQKMMVITIDNSRGHNDVLVVTTQGTVGWIDKHSLEILLLY